MFKRMGKETNTILCSKGLLLCRYQAPTGFESIEKMDRYVSNQEVKGKQIWMIQTPIDVSYRKTCLKQPLKRRPEIGFQDQLLLNVGQKCCAMLPRSILQYF